MERRLRNAAKQTGNPGPRDAVEGEAIGRSSDRRHRSPLAGGGLPLAGNERLKLEGRRETGGLWLARAPTVG